MRPRALRDALLVGGLLLLVGLVSAALVRGESAGEQAVWLASDSNERDGARALALWLASQGHAVERLAYREFELSDEVDLLFVLAPLTPFTSVELDRVDRWVRRGGTLVLAYGAGEGVFADESLLDHFDARLELLPEGPDALTLSQPLLIYPAVGPIATDAYAGLRLARSRAVVHAALDDVPVLVSFPLDRGQVWLTTLGGAFSNAGLHDPASARLIFNLVEAARNPPRVLFDEIHHGRRLSEGGFDAWLWTSPLGRAGLFLGALLFGFALVRGRRFGRPLPAPEALARRGPEEYVLAMAGLFRRAGLRGAVARHYHDRLKRVLGQRFRIDPGRPDAEFVAELGSYRADLDTPGLQRLLVALAAPRPAEADLVRLAAEAGRWEQLA